MNTKRENKMKQKIVIEAGINKNVCPICDKSIHYPAGVYFRNGVEVHCKCVTIARTRRGKIAGIDYIKESVAKLTEIYCSTCGHIEAIKIEDLKNHIKCTFCGSYNINEA
jgi:hypothetical protein